jgi:hypothetical protein
MPATMTEALAEVRERLDEPEEDNWSESFLRMCINEGCKDVSRKTESIRDSDDIAITAGDGTYPGPVDMIRISKVELRETGNTAVYTLKFYDFNVADSVWWTGQEQSQARPVMWTFRGTVPTVTIQLYPIPSTAGTITVSYYRLASIIDIEGGSDGSTLDIPEGWDDLVYAYAEYRALRRDRDPRHQEAKAEYDEKMTDMLTLTGQLTDNPSEIAPEIPFGLPAWLYAG